MGKAEVIAKLKAKRQQKEQVIPRESEAPVIEKEVVVKQSVVIEKDKEEKTQCCFCRLICLEGTDQFHRIDSETVCHRACAKKRWGYDPKR